MQIQIKYDQLYSASSTQDEWREDLARYLIQNKLCEIDIDQLETKTGAYSTLKIFYECFQIYKSVDEWKNPPRFLFNLVDSFNQKKFASVYAYLQRFTAYRRNIYSISQGPMNNSIYIFSMPKSGVTYLLNFLNLYFNMTGKNLGYHAFFTLPPMNISYETLYNTANYEKTIFHCHAPYDPLISNVLKKNGQTPIIIVRDIFEAIESMIDYHNSSLVRDERNLSKDTSYDQRRGQSFGFIGKKETNLTNGISKYACDFIDFYAQWVRAQSVLQNPIFSYDLLKTEPELFFSQIISFCRKSADQDKIRSTLNFLESEAEFDNKTLNINKKGKGRGIQNFTDAQIQNVRRIYELYPDVNFSLIDKNLHNH